jgi:hypothetical protein
MTRSIPRAMESLPVAICPNCGVEAPNTAAFCPQCGAQLQPARSGAPVAAAAPPIAGGAPAGVPLAQPVDTVERELWTGNYSPKAMVGSLIGGIVLTAAAVAAVVVFRNSLAELWWAPLAAIAALWIYLGGQIALRKWSVKYRLTNQRFFHERGILRRVVNRIELIDIDDIGYVQKLVDRMFDVGQIRITSSDRTDPALVLVGIDHVKDVAGLIDNARRQERIKRGIHIEQI